MNGVADLFQGHAARDHHHALTDQGVRMVGEEVHADDAPTGLVPDQLDETVGLLLELKANHEGWRDQSRLR